MGSLCIYPDGCRGQEVANEVSEKDLERSRFQRTYEYGCAEGSEVRDVARNTVNEMKKETNALNNSLCDNCWWRRR